MDSQPEVWLRGPVPGIPAELLPAAHAFLQTMEDVERVAGDLSLDQLWQTPGGAASVGFHILHLSGSTDRLLTYARGERLSADQKAALSAEDSPPRLPASELIAQLRSTIAPSRSAVGIPLRVPDGRSRGAPNHDPRPPVPRRRTFPAACGPGCDD